MFIEGGGADATQFAAGQHRLEQIAGIHGTAAGAGTHHGVDLIDEQHDLPFGGGDLLEHGLEPLLKLTAVLGTGNQRAHVEGDQLAVLQRLGHIAVDDALGQPLHNGGLADAGLADQHRVVLGAAREDLNRAADLLIAADHRIELAFAGRLGEIAAVFLQRFIGAFRVLIRHPLTAAHGLHRLLELVGIGAGLGEQLLGATIVDRQGEHQVLNGDEAVFVGFTQGIGLVQHLVESLAQVDVVGWGTECSLGGDVGLHLLAQAAHLDAGFLENPARQTLLGEQGCKQMFTLHLLLALLLGQLLGGNDRRPGLLGEQFGGGMHAEASGGEIVGERTVWPLGESAAAEHRTSRFGPHPSGWAGRPDLAGKPTLCFTGYTLRPFWPYPFGGKVSGHFCRSAPASSSRFTALKRWLLSAVAAAPCPGATCRA